MAKKLFIAMITMLLTVNAFSQVIMSIDYGDGGDRYARLSSGQLINLDKIEGINPNNIKEGMTLQEGVTFARAKETQRIIEKRREAQADMMAEQISAAIEGYYPTMGAYPMVGGAGVIPMGYGYGVDGTYESSSFGIGINIGGLSAGYSKSENDFGSVTSKGVQVDDGVLHVHSGKTQVETKSPTMRGERKSTAKKNSSTEEKKSSVNVEDFFN
jgi:hypothetical protein